MMSEQLLHPYILSDEELDAGYAAMAADEELTSLVTAFDTVAVRSLAACVHGAVRLADGDASGALSALRRGQEGWQQVGAPYEVAESRMNLQREAARVYPSPTH